MIRALVIPIGRSTFDLELGAIQVAAAWPVLTAAGLDAIGRPEIVTELTDLDTRFDDFDTRLGQPEAPFDADVVVVLQATFCDSSLVGRIAERLRRPILVWSFPEARTGERLRLNSLCGANLAAYLLRRRHHPCGFVHVDPASSNAADDVRRAIGRSADVAPGTIAGGTIAGGTIAVATVDVSANAVAADRTTQGRAGLDVARRLWGARIGVVGDAPTGFEPCEGDDLEVRRVTGLDVDRVALTTLFARADAASAADCDATAARIAATMDVSDVVAAAGLAESIRLHEGLRSLVGDRRWGAVATRCWPECMTEYGGAMCTPMAMLSEDGVPAVCEADLYGAVTALFLREVSGSEPFIADLVDADADDNTSVVWHCGLAAAPLAEPTERRVGITHPNRHRALVNQFALRPGRVTMARLSQAGGATSLVIGRGEMLQRRRPFLGTCGVVRWDEPIRDVMATVFDRGLEHHVGIVYGDHHDVLVSLGAIWEIPVVALGAP